MALSKNEIVKFIDDFKVVNRDCVAGALQIYRGALINSDTSGNAKLASDAASELFAGVAMEEVTQAATASAADNQVQLISKGSGRVVRLQLTGVTKASIGLKCYANGDDIVALAATTTNDVEVGTIVDIDSVANYCWVQI